jgi:hypothetical protein
MKYINTDNKIKIGDYVRIIMCCYPMPSGEMLGKVSEIEEIFESINMVKLKRWGINVNYSFIEESSTLEDRCLKISENTVFKW